MMISNNSTSSMALNSCSQYIKANAMLFMALTKPLSYENPEHHRINLCGRSGNARSGGRLPAFEDG
jgi:hypothetical protein